MTRLPPPETSNLNERSFDTVVSEGVDQIFSDNEREAFSSNNTSFLEDDVETRESYFSGGTQLEQGLIEDISFSRQITLAENTSKVSIDKLFKNLSHEGPLQYVKDNLPQDIPFWFRFELHRLSMHLQIPIKNLYDNITKLEDPNPPEYSTFWRKVVDASRESSLPVPTKSSIKSWTLKDNIYNEIDSNKAVKFSARLDFRQHETQKAFDVTLLPMALNKSHRFQREVWC